MRSTLVRRSGRSCFQGRNASFKAARELPPMGLPPVPGQTKDVTVCRIVSKGPIEELVREWQRAKQTLADEAIG